MTFTVTIITTGATFTAEDLGDAFKIAAEEIGLSIGDTRESGAWFGDVFRGGEDDTAFTIAG